MKIIGVLYNTIYGGFCLPDEIVREFKELYGEDIDGYMDHSDKMRADQRLVELYQNSDYYKDGYISIRKVPEECEWFIRENDGKEWVSWKLPESKIINDLRMILIGEALKHSVSPITQKFLTHGGTIENFQNDYISEFIKHRDHSKRTKTDS